MNRRSTRLEGGFSLIELMIAVAIIAIIAAVALPMYREYVDTAGEGRLVTNIATMEVFQEDFRLRTGAYLLVAADIATIEAAIGWEPQQNDGTTYAITDPGTGSYDVTATGDDGFVVCMRYPEKVRCP